MGHLCNRYLQKRDGKDTHTMLILMIFTEERRGGGVQWSCFCLFFFFTVYIVYSEQVLIL